MNVTIKFPKKDWKLAARNLLILLSICSGFGHNDRNSPKKPLFFPKISFMQCNAMQCNAMQCNAMRPKLEPFKKRFLKLKIWKFGVPRGYSWRQIPTSNCEVCVKFSINLTLLRVGGKVYIQVWNFKLFYFFI